MVVCAQEEIVLFKRVEILIYDYRLWNTSKYSGILIYTCYGTLHIELAIHEPLGYWWRTKDYIYIYASR